MPEKTKPIQPLISAEMMERIVSSRRSISSEEALKAMAEHTGKPIRSARKAIYKDGQKVWVSC